MHGVPQERQPLNLSPPTLRVRVGNGHDSWISTERISKTGHSPPTCSAIVASPEIAEDVPAIVDVAGAIRSDNHAGMRGRAAVAAVQEIIHPNCRRVCTSRGPLLQIHLQ